MPLFRHREEIFCQHVANGMSQSEAYAAVGFKPDAGNCSRFTRKDRIQQRIAELQQQNFKKAQAVLIKQASITRQYLIDALMENLDIALGRRPVKQGPAAIPVEQYVYRGETANTAIKMAGSECGLFQDKTEVTHHMNFDDLSDEQLLLRLRDETEALLLERRAAGLDNGGDDPEPDTGNR